MSQPLVLISLFFAVGIALAEVSQCPPGFSGGLALALMLAVGYRWWRPGRGFFVLLSALSLALGGFWLGLSKLPASQLAGFSERYLDLTGMVNSEARMYPDREVYLFRVQFREEREGSLPVEEDALLVLAGNPDRPSLSYGEIISLTGKVQLPRSARNPGEFDYRQYLARQGVSVQILSSPEEVYRLGRRSGFFLRRWAIDLRSRVEESIRRELPPQQASYLAAVLFGDKSGLSAAELELYQRLGLVHIFSVSGLHLGFVLALSLLLARGLRLKGAGFFLFNLLSMLFYAAMVGFPPPTMRALLMAALTLGAYLFKREANPLGGLFLAGLVLLISNPRLLFDAGFQLSFSATGGLVYLYPRLQALAAGWPRGVQWLLLPLAAQLGILPLVAYYYSLVSPVSLFTNLVLVGLLGAIVMVGMLAIPIILMFPLLGEYLLLSAGALVELADLSVGLFNAVPGGVWYPGTPSKGLVLAYYAAGVAWVEGWFAKIKASPTKTAWAAGLAAAAAVALLLHPAPSGRLQVVFLDVGQGDSIHIATPGGRNLLIDGGGRTPNTEGYFDVGSRIVLPYLRREGIGRLDLLVNTHPHDDHLEGIYSLVESMPVNQVLVSAVSVDHPGTRALLSRCAARGIALSVVKRGDYLEIEPGLRLEVLHPGSSPLNPQDENENSIVLRLVYRDTAFLLTGDLGRPGMEEIMKSGMALGSQVLKVPHHGSALGLEEEFLKQVGAEVGIISVGSNHFGHPAPEVLRYWQETRRPLFRTDQKGAIIVTSDGKNLWVATQLKGAGDGS